MNNPIKCLRMECLFLAAAMFFVGCERSSSKTGTGPPPQSSTKATEEQTTVTPLLLPRTRFGDHEAFGFEITGPPAIFVLEAHWSPNPKGANLSDETLLYSTETYLEKHNVGVWEEKSEERGSVIAFAGRHDSAFRCSLYQQLLDAVATHRVADRPDRFEPRRRKRRPKPYDRLMKPRHEAKRDMLNGLSEN